MWWKFGKEVLQQARPTRHALGVLASIPLLAVVLAAATGSARAGQESSDDHRTYVSFTLDNDFFAGYDHHYTNGLQVAFSADKTRLPESLRSLPPLRWSSDPHITFAIGQRMYTPSDTKRSQPDPLDRPYGGWLYALADVRVRTGSVVDSVQASLGVIGPASMAKQTQNNYHKLIGADETNGWHAQIGTAPALLLGYERAWPSIQSARIGRFAADVTPRVGATIGNVYTYGNAGAVLRFGQNLPDDYPVTDISLGPPRDGFRPSGSGTGWYVWVGTEARLVAFNAFLDGNLFSNDPSVQRKPFGHDLQLGLTALYSKARVGFTFVTRSKEFETQAGADRFGQVAISFPI
ncbi:MAG TPA: lipid A deacylase LpxR family protein [Burkholderiaceae bacterium]|nr:lipid A deacylase LpxR family protein [Burkholderiaceae bacterium]